MAMSGSAVGTENTSKSGFGGLLPYLMRSISKIGSRNPYRRVNRYASSKRRSKIRVVRLGSGRKSWRLKVGKFPKLRLVSPITLLAKLRDAYVRMMLNLSNSLSNQGGMSSVGLLMGGHIYQPSSFPGRQYIVSCNQLEMEMRYLEYLQRERYSNAVPLA